MEKEKTVTNIKEITANPAPLGLMGFGMTTILLNIHNAGFFELNAMILGMGIFYGGLAQVIAGIMEFKKNNTFGTTAFTSYGFFWLSLVALNMIPLMGYGEAANSLSMSAYLFMWGLFTLFMFIGTLRINAALQVVFGTLTILFFLLAIANFTGSSLILTIAGYEGILCGFTAIYAAMAQVLNELYDKTLLPIGERKVQERLGNNLEMRKVI
ncbi:acetate uptake transporter [Neobacillus niacini]|uniref:acetate uptake transporter n=1 Tax=Neobacillus niacini TaxID=86668 RepID=UPI0021CB0C8F|nr:acetate uptake transporter [Neobacillus niacini]MCM3766276.1 acetate uptake transporter [Neobacillus niacini]